MQLTRAYADFGNGGALVTPTFVKGTPPAQHAIVDPAIAAKVLTILEAVTGDGGTATRSNVPGYRVPGKTGTSRKASGGGSADRKSVVQGKSVSVRADLGGLRRIKTKKK